MFETNSIIGSTGRFDGALVLRQATPGLVMKLGIQLHPAGLSISNTIWLIDIFGVEQARPTVQNWVHKADPQPDDGHPPNQIAVDETVIWINGEQYWLHGAVDPISNENSLQAFN